MQNHTPTAPSAEQPADDPSPRLLAFRVGGGPELRLVPALRERAWMEATRERFAYRCLPLVIASQAGWWLLSSHALEVTWDGREDIAGLRVVYRAGDPPYPAISHFGHGILTWHLPYLFRTSPGWNLLVRGPANWPKDGIVPLEGLVETDWAVATFTMNWKVTAVGRPIQIEVDEPICQLVPQRRGELEAFVPEIRTLESDPAVAAAYQGWSDSRSSFLAELHVPESEAVRRKWQKDYFHGSTPDGSRAPAHQTKLRLHGFTEPTGVCPPEDASPRDR